MLASVKGSFAPRWKMKREEFINLVPKCGYGTKGAKATNKIKAMPCDTILALSVLTIRDELDFGKQRCERYIKRFNQKTECLLDDMLKWKDVLDTVREEMGIDLSIRQND